MARQLPLENYVPGLRTAQWRFTSLEDIHYNCIAFAIGDDHNWWEPSGWPIHYWPPGIKVEYSLDSYTEIYTIHGFEICKTNNRDFEKGYDKIALFVDKHGLPSHAARQTETGAWKSKMGEFEDIEHESLSALEGDDNYGTVVRILKRLRPAKPGCLGVLIPTGRGSK